MNELFAVPIPLPAPVPANMIETAVTIAVILVTFIGWIAQVASSAAKKAPQPAPRRAAPPRPAPARDARLQGEIDSFLREVSNRRNPRREPDDFEEAEEVDVEIVEDEPPRFGQRPAPAAPVAGTPSKWDVEQTRRRERLMSTLGERQFASSGLGAELRKHVEEFSAESHRLRQEKERVELDLAQARNEIQSLRSRATMGIRPESAPAEATGGVRPRLAALFRDRESVRNAIIVNEVFGRPKSAVRRNRGAGR